MPDLRWPPFENMTQFLRHVTSSAYVADFKGNIFDYLPSKGGVFGLGDHSGMRILGMGFCHPVLIPESLEW